MIRIAFVFGVAMVLCACVSTPVAVAPKKAWPDRLTQLQGSEHWHLEGRAAVAVGTQGWQASLDWRQQAGTADVRLAGPLGAGAFAFRLSPAGLELIGTPSASNPSDFLQQRLGFAPPLENLKFWLLGVPNPTQAFEWQRNDLDRASQLSQDGWVIDYADYMDAGADILPRHITLHRDQVRLRIAVDRWDPVK